VRYIYFQPKELKCAREIRSANLWRPQWRGDLDPALYKEEILSGSPWLGLPSHTELQTWRSAQDRLFGLQKQLKNAIFRPTVACKTGFPCADCWAFLPRTRGRGPYQYLTLPNQVKRHWKLLQRICEAFASNTIHILVFPFGLVTLGLCGCAFSVTGADSKKPLIYILNTNFSQ
jgi:hypothetical protein